MRKTDRKERFDMTVFERELKIIRKEIIKHIVLACVSAIPGLILAVFAFGKTSPLPILVISLIFFVPAAVLLIGALKYKNIYGQYANIQNTHKTYDVELKSPKVKFLLVSKGRHSFSRALLGIVLIDENKNRYFYIVPETFLLNWENLISAQNKIKEKCNREFHIQCYENTNVIRSVGKDVHFLHFRLGKLCD